MGMRKGHEDSIGMEFAIASASPDVTDANLVRIARDSTHELAETAFYVLYTGYAPLVERVIRRTNRKANQQEVDDLVQKTFTQAARKLNSFDLERPFGPWIAKIAERQTITHFRHSNRRPWEIPIDFLDMPSTVDEPFEQAVHSERKRTLWSAVAQLGTTVYQIFTLKYQHEMSHAEIAKKLGIPKGTVDATHVRALERLRNMDKLRAALDHTREEPYDH
jgi:RNA polymerase sigma-70 factor (ECF subfamily)